MQTGFKTFGTDERGTVAMMFGLTTTALLFISGMAVDYSRAMNVRSRVADAADSAALVAGRALMEGKLSTGEIRAMALKYFEQNTKSLGNSAILGSPQIKINPNSGEVSVDVDAKVSMTLTKIAGFNTLDVPVTTTAVFKQKDIEVGMALDITGSMGGSVAGGGTKIAGLKKAFETFADRLIPTHPTDLQKVRIGVAPYSYSVNLGRFSNAAMTGNASNCSQERKDGSYSDALGYFYSSPRNTCPNSEIMTLSDDRDALVDAVNRYIPNGSTAGHLGVQWAWNLVSPKWGKVWGGNSIPVEMDEVRSGKVLKAVVLMTDGEFNTAYHGPTSDKQAVALCDAMKAEGIVVFSVGFGLGGNSAAIKTLQSCATPGSGYFANAKTTEDLETAFTNFAGKLTELRLAM